MYRAAWWLPSLNQPLEVHLWRGNGCFSLYEDDGESMDYSCGAFTVTTFRMEEVEDTLRLTITPSSDRHGLLPEKRTMYLVFRDVEAEEIVVTVGDQPVTVSLTNPRARETDTKEELRSALLTRVQARNLWKNAKFGAKLPKFIRDALAELDAMI